MKPFKNHLLATAILMAVSAPTAVMAESASDSGTTPLSAAVNLDFQIDIPGILNFQVGAAGTTVDLITFAPTAANLGNGTDISGSGGNLSGGVVSVELLSNAGVVTITETNSSGGAGLTNGTENISYAEILTASNLPALPAPVLSDSDLNTSTPTLTDGIADLSAQWTYTYDNSAVYEAGTYGGVNTQGGRVTYTAFVP